MSKFYDQFYKGFSTFIAETFKNLSKFFIASSRSSNSSANSCAQGLMFNDEPITLFRLELERLQYIIHFPEEVAFQVEIF